MPTERHVVLLLGGTSEASGLAQALATDARITLIVSLAGRTASPSVPYGRLRNGGFGGVAGLAAYLRAEQVRLLVDATHPFAAVMPYHAAEACQATGVALLKVYRPAWPERADDRWLHVPDLSGAAQALERSGARRVFLTTGRTDLEPFRRLRQITFVVRSIEAPDLTGFASAQAVLSRGPFAPDAERRLLAEHAIDTLVTKNSGGSAAHAKLEAARALGVRVVMVDRPPMPSVPLVESAAQALAWISAFLARSDTSVA